MEFLNIKPVNFSENVCGSVINLAGKKYSDLGMSREELSERIGIPKNIASTYDNWYILNGEFYYFKKRMIFTELLVTEIARKCGIRCVDFRLAINSNGEIGIISKLYRERGKEYYSYSEFCTRFFGEVKNDLSWFSLGMSVRFTEEQKNIFMDDIFGIIALGLFCGQWDNGLEGDNLFIENDPTMGPRIAPLCDTSGCFSLSYDYESPFGTFSLCSDDDVIDKRFIFLLGNDDSLFNKIQLLINIDVERILMDIISRYGILIESDNKQKILDYFEQRRNIMNRALELGGLQK